MEVVTRVPGGEGIVFALALSMAVGAFAAAAGLLDRRSATDIVAAPVAPPT